MRLRAPLLAAAFLLSASAALAQTPGVHGKFVDAATSAAVPGVKLTLRAVADTTDVHRLTAKDDGTFAVTGVKLRAYRLEASRLGYSPLSIVVTIRSESQDLGLLPVTSQAVNVRGITVRESPPPAAVRGDTTEFRAAAVKTNPDATAEDLVQKLPGVTVENGTVKSNGEQIQQVLVNGKPFFGSDPTAAMRNLPADVVDRIQVFDKMSDQAEFSGFDDGQSQKTMNFILRNQKAQFGKAYAGYGDRDRYQAGGNATTIRGATRVTAIGMSNNINQQNFSPQDLVGAMSGGGGGGGGGGGMRMIMMGGPRGGGGMRGGGGGGLGGGFDPGNFMVGQQSGVSTTHAGGLNATTQAGKTLSLTGSMFANQTNNDDTQQLARTYTPPQDSTLGYGQNSVNSSRNGNQRFDGRLEWTPDSTNSVIDAPRLYYQHNRTGSNGSAGYTSLLGYPLANSDSRTLNVTDGNNLSNRLTLRHRFARHGRNVSADVSFGHTLRDGARGQNSLTDYWLGDSLTSSSALDQSALSHTVTNTWSTRIAYTEPLGAHWQAQLTYNPSASHSDADTRTFNVDTATGLLGAMDTTQSNTFASRTTTQNAGLAALHTTGTWRWLSTLAWQELRLESERLFPVPVHVDQTFRDMLPSMQLNGSFTARRTLRLSWNTSTGTPSIGQLQDVADRSNPLAITTGNPGLRESYTNTVSLRYMEADPLKSKSRFVFFNLSRTTDPIANATYGALRDTVIHGIALARGAQLTRPENLGTPSWSANAFGVYSRPVTFLKSIVSVNGGGSYTQTPTRVSAGLNVAKTWAPRAGVVFASNISQNLDFTLMYQGSYNIARNSLSSSTTGDYYAHTIGFRFNGIAPHGIVVREEVNHNLQSGAASGYNRDIVLWNTTLGKKFLKDNRGELRITLTDALAQDRSVTRTITESYVQDARDQTLGRYVQAVFTYTFGGNRGQGDGPGTRRIFFGGMGGPPPGGPPPGDPH